MTRHVVDTGEHLVHEVKIDLSHAQWIHATDADIRRRYEARF